MQTLKKVPALLVLILAIGLLLIGANAALKASTPNKGDYVLSVYLCTVLEGQPSPECKPSVTRHATQQDCLNRADYFDHLANFKRTYKGDVAVNEVALTQISKCEKVN